MKGKKRKKRNEKCFVKKKNKNQVAMRVGTTGGWLLRRSSSVQKVGVPDEKVLKACSCEEGDDLFD